MKGSSSDSDNEFYTKENDIFVNQKQEKYTSSSLVSLAFLKPMLQNEVIKHYPKLALLAFDTFSEYMEVFDNEFCSLYT